MLAALCLAAACDSGSPATTQSGNSNGGITTLGGDTDSDTEGTGSVVSATSGATDSDTATSGGSGSSGTDGFTTGEDVSTSLGDSTTSEGNDATLLFLRVEPPETILELDLNMAGAQDFTVEAVYSDGDIIDVTPDIAWSVSNPAVGAMNGATLQIPAFADNFFESAILTAELEGETGQAQITVASYDFAQDFFFVLPFEDRAGNQDQPLTFSTDVKSMDVFINMDTTFSMSEELANLQNALTNTIIPTIQATVPNTQFGVGNFEDFPLSGYGVSGSDQPFELGQEITNNVAEVQAAVQALALGNGADIPESNIEAMYQIATGEGLVTPAPTNVAANAAGIGGVGFREGALPVVVSITDAISHDTASNACGQEQYTGTVAAAAHSQAEALDALNAICGRVIQIAASGTGACTAYEDAVQFSEGTGAVIPPEAWDIDGRPPGCAAGQCCTGLNGQGRAPNAAGLCPMAYTAATNGTGVDSSFSSAVSLLAAYGRFDVTSAVSGVMTDEDGVALPAGTSTADFIQTVTPFDHGPVPLPGVPDPTLTPTTFEDVIPDTDVIFSVVAYNDFVEQTSQPRLFTANIQILADDCGELDDRDVFILVPPEDLPAPG